MTSVVEIRRDLAAMDAVGWSLAGLEESGPGWRQFMRDDEHPKFMREYDRLSAKLQEEDEPRWLN